MCSSKRNLNCFNFLETDLDTNGTMDLNPGRSLECIPPNILFSSDMVDCDRCFRVVDGYIDFTIYFRDSNEEGNAGMSPVPAPRRPTPNPLGQEEKLPIHEDFACAA